MVDIEDVEDTENDIIVGVEVAREEEDARIGDALDTIGIVAVAADPTAAIPAVIATAAAAVVVTTMTITKSVVGRKDERENERATSRIPKRWRRSWRTRPAGKRSRRTYKLFSREFI